MQSIYELVIFEVENEHNLSHKQFFLSLKNLLANGNLKKRWFVYYSYQNSISVVLQRMKNVYFGQTDI
jgi:hypothetical protein